jgi:hypothetical protein
MKKLFYSILLKFSSWLIHKAFKLNTHCENNLADIAKKKKSVVNTENIIAFVVASVFITAFSLIDFCPNIQDVKVDKPEKVVVEIDDDYQLAKKNFTFLDGNKDVWDYVLKKSEERNVDPLLVLAIMKKESGISCRNDWQCMTKIKGGSGEIGAMQVMPYHADNPNHLYDWRYNTDRGIWYLSEAINYHASGNVKVGVRLYNQGHYGKAKNYKRWGYPRDVMRFYKKVLTQKVMVAKI